MESLETEQVMTIGASRGWRGSPWRRSATSGAPQCGRRSSTSCCRDCNRW